MFLAIDVGNTTTAFGVAQSETDPWIATLRLSSERQRPPDEWYSLLSPHLRSPASADRRWKVVVSSVVPAITDAFRAMVRHYFSTRPLIYSPQLDLGIEIATSQPTETGSDRVLNGAAAFAQYGGPVIVVDMGTATKIDIVDRSGRFLGGAIAPGIGVSMETLAGRAARLYATPLSIPDEPIGRDTVGALQSGIVLGHLSMIEGMIARFAAENGPIPHVVLTGGYSSIIADALRPRVVHEPSLTLEGLRILAKRNPPESDDPA